MSLPAETPAPDPRDITQALEDDTAGDPSLNVPVHLFQSENDASINVNSTSLSPPRAASSLGKRDAPTPKQTGKRQDTTTSPLRSILNSAAAFVHQITQTQPQTVLPPSHVDVERSDDGPSPT